MSKKFEREQPRESPFKSSPEQQKRTDRLNRAHQALDAKVPHPGKTAAEKQNAYRKQVSEFHEAWREAFPPNFDWCIKLLKAKDSEGLEVAVCFLEDDPWFFTSGYAKANLLHYISKIDLSDEYKTRLRKVIINAIDYCYRNEFRRYTRLAKYVSDEQFVTQLNERISGSDSHVKRRAQWVLDALSQSKRPSNPICTR